MSRPHRPSCRIEALALDLLLDPGAGELGPEFLVEGVLARLFQLVERAGLAELLGELGGGLGGRRAPAA